MTLDLSAFRTVFDDDFANDTWLSGTLWADRWGSADQYSFGPGGLTLTASAADSWNPVGFMQAPTGKSAGEGYGLFQFSGYANAGQGIGICFEMWRADNVVVDASQPNVATEIDILESWDKTKTGNSVIHYYNTGWSGNNGYKVTNYSVDLTTVHTYAMDWERGSLTFYIDGTEIYQDTVHAPLDYADGGSNEVMGAALINERSLVTTPTVQLHITDMSYGVPVSQSSATAVANQAPIVLGSGVQSYVAATGTVVQAGSGSDTVYAMSGGVVVNGSSGALTFLGGNGSNTVNGGTGAATILGGAGGGNYIGGSAGPNVLVSQGASGANTTLTGAAYGDELFGSAGGNDLLVAAVGRESLMGGGGNDTIVGGGTASSVIFSGSGPTSVFGGVAGGDLIVQGAGDLALSAQFGDAVFGSGARLSVTGSTSGADSVIGGAGTLSVTGRGGNMLVVAGLSTSTIATGNGASLIFGESGGASVVGGSGSMEVVIGAGSLSIGEGTGGAAYQVVKGSAGGSAVLNGYRPGTDTISLYGYKPVDVSVVAGSASTLIALSDGTRIQVMGVSNLGNSLLT